MVRSLGISHVGIAVFDLESAVRDYKRLFDFDKIDYYEIGHEGVKVAMLRSGDSEIELLSATREDSSIAKFIKERGEGIHHMAIRVPSVIDAVRYAKSLGIRVLDDKPRRGAGGAQAAFVHPKSAHGVLLEFYDR
jgi:methylmalonyl-CoA/ethylmalonyl-CoA epimerase